MSCAGRCSLLLLLWNCRRCFVFNHLSALTTEGYFLGSRAILANSCNLFKNVEIVSKLWLDRRWEVLKVRIHLCVSGKFANFFLQALLYVGEHQQGVWGLEERWEGLLSRQGRMKWPWGQGEGKVGDTGRKHTERKAQRVPWTVYMYMLRKGDFAARKFHQRNWIKRKVKLWDGKLLKGILK